MPVGPPLGRADCPSNPRSSNLPSGSRLVLFTDGLVQSRSSDVETALALLRDMLARAPASLEETSDQVLSALLPSRPADDVALLVARTRALDAGHVATWDLPCDPAVVSKARAAADQLAAWGLDDMAFITELVVSELVTNAIRYGRSPIQLRLILLTPRPVRLRRGVGAMDVRGRASRHQRAGPARPANGGHPARHGRHALTHHLCSRLGNRCAPWIDARLRQPEQRQVHGSLKLHPTGPGRVHRTRVALRLDSRHQGTFLHLCVLS
ncbi:SpoIIE family protein phosphatase [Streptomyces sp. SA15]|uniref:SpoIIE family protein phosphatase n=1 Tax=Streptomyces sp. SA15 TaxID=934019 RepID=UPI0027BB04DF|nr:SpoIIE family protein phosphatase [Streptomyces sp. SA15]